MKTEVITKKEVDLDNIDEYLEAFLENVQKGEIYPRTQRECKK